MTRESTIAKAGRYLIEGRIIITAVAPGHVTAIARGDQRLYRVTYRHPNWSCDCPARRRCSHLIAVRRVVAADIRQRGAYPRSGRGMQLTSTHHDPTSDIQTAPGAPLPPTTSPTTGRGRGPGANANQTTPSYEHHPHPHHHPRGTTPPRKPRHHTARPSTLRFFWYMCGAWFQVWEMFDPSKGRDAAIAQIEHQLSVVQAVKDAERNANDV